MFVTVVIPVYNRPVLLRRALESVSRQTCQSIDLVVVDDASSTDLNEIREEVEAGGGYWIRLPKRSGPAAARNAGVAATKSPWIAFLDSDDEWEPEKLELQLRWHRENPAVPISQVAERWIRNGAEVKKRSYQEQRGGDLFAVACRQCAIAPSCVMISRDLWDRHGGFDERFDVCEDYELWLRITAEEQVGYIPEALVRRHGGHDDQLSVTAVAMDRYRVAGLLKMLRSYALGKEEKAHVCGEITAKSAVLAAGAAKRGLTERSLFFSRLAEISSGELEEELDEFISGTWDEIKNAPG